jgi:hypothetical protein
MLQARLQPPRASAYLEDVRPSVRKGAFGATGLLVLAGAACAALVEGVLGEVLTVALMSAGFGGAALLLFLEVGLGEDRDRAREELERHKRDELRLKARRRFRGRLRGRPRRPG